MRKTRLLRTLLLGVILVGGTGGLAIAAPIDVVIFKDSFDGGTHADGQIIANSTPEVGVRWQDIGGLTAQNTTTTTQGNPGLSFRQVRESGNGPPPVVTRIDGSNPNNLTQANRTYTIKFDYRTTDDADGSTVIWAPGVNPSVGPEFDLLNGTWRYYNPTSGTFVNSNVDNGSGAWNTIEIEIHTGADSGSGTFPMSFDFYLTRGAGGTLPAMARTNILSGAHPTAGAVGDQVSLWLSAATGADTLYYDNVNIGYAVPEPASLAALGLVVGIGALRRRRL